MPLQNRVLPTGEIIATPARGLFMGNRGILHDDHKQLTHARWRHKAWVTCVLEFKNRKRVLMQPNAYTELFFLDEAVALAAGHRPCAECRRADFLQYKDAAGIVGRVAEFDNTLHRARAIPRKYDQVRQTRAANDLPDGSFVLSETGQPALLWQDQMLPFAPGGYEAPRSRPKGCDLVTLTPEPNLRALAEGYTPKLHPSAGM